MTPTPCKIGSPEWLTQIRARYRTDEEISSWYQPEEPDSYARRVVSDLVRMIDALTDERDAALLLDNLPLSEWPADARDKRHSLELAAVWKEAHDRMRAAQDDRDRLAAALADVREAAAVAVQSLFEEQTRCPLCGAGDTDDGAGHSADDCDLAALDAVLTVTPADLATARDARVLREAATICLAEIALTPFDATSHVAKIALKSAAKKIHAEADRIERGGR